MLGARLIGLCAAAALALSALAGVATAAESSPGAAVAFDLRGSDGYRLFLLGGVRPGETAGEVAVFVGKRGARAVYAAPATFTETTVEADLGPLGRISLQAVPSGEERVARSKCDKRRSVRYEPVDYVGEFEFRGEEGYTEARATRLPNLVQPFLDLLCSRIVGEREGGPGLPGAGLRVASRGRASRFGLLARTNGPGKPVVVSASVHEQRGEIEIERSVYGRYRPGVFGYDPNLARATLEPPAPFSGRGVFSRSAAPANRWTGDLRVDFPGRSGVAVTGDRFRPTLSHGRWRGSEPVRARPRLAAPTLPAWPSTKR